MTRQTDQEQTMTEQTPMIHTAQSTMTDVTTLVAYQANDGRVHVERVTVYLANVLHEMRLTVPMPTPHVGTCRGCGARVTGTPVDRKALAFAQGGDDLHAARCVTSTGTVRTDGAPRPLA